MGLIYIVTNEIGYQTTITGIYTSKEDAEKFRDTIISKGKVYSEISFLDHAKEKIEAGNKSFEGTKDRFPNRKRWDWIDLTPEQYIKTYMIKMYEVETNKEIDLIMYAE